MTHGNLTNGSKIIFLAITIFDILLANITYYVIVNCGYFTVPDAIIGKELNGVICATIAALIGVMTYGNLIYQQRISVPNVISRVFRHAFVQALAIMALTRMMVDSSQSILRLSAIYLCAYFTLLLITRFIERQLLNALVITNTLWCISEATLPW